MPRLKIPSIEEVNTAIEFVEESLRNLKQLRAALTAAEQESDHHEASAIPELVQRIFNNPKPKAPPKHLGQLREDIHITPKNLGQLREDIRSARQAGAEWVELDGQALPVEIAEGILAAVEKRLPPMQ